MPRLSRLGLECLTPEVLDSLQAEHITTVEDLLVRDLYALSIKGHNQKAIEGILNYLRQSYAPSWKNGADLYLQLQKTTSFSTGCAGLDNLLGGGLRPGTMTELVGSSASGKTQLCLQAAATAALQHKVAVAYVDTSHSFSGNRLAQMLAGLCGGKHRAQECTKELKHALSSVLLYKAFDIYHVLALLDNITVRKHSAFQGDDFFARLGVVVVDSASALISPVLGGATSQGYALMISVSQALKQLATSFNIAVLITNHTVSGEGGEPKPALGESWKNVPNFRVFLAREETPGSNQDICRATLVKHTSKAVGEVAHIQLAQDGVRTITPSSRDEDDE